MPEAEHFGVTVKRVELEGEFVWRATVKELPDFAVYGDSAHEAYDSALEAVADLQMHARDLGSHFPQPEEDSPEYSGRITLRLPLSLHAKYAHLADRDGTSLNQFLVTVLANWLSRADAGDRWSDNPVMKGISRKRTMPTTVLTEFTRSKVPAQLVNAPDRLDRYTVSVTSLDAMPSYERIEWDLPSASGSPRRRAVRQ